MLNTVKKRLLFFTTLLLVIFSVVVISFVVNFFNANKSHRVENTKTQVAFIAEKISNQYEEHKTIATELSGIASTFYLSGGKDKNILKTTIKNNYKGRLPIAGVGVWYDEFIVNKAKKWFCVFAYVQDDKIVFNDSLENNAYNYLKKPWFLLIKEKAIEGFKNIYTPTTCSATGRDSYVLTIGSGIYANNKMVGIITVDWLLDDIKSRIAYYKPTKGSNILFADKENDFIIALTGSEEKVTSNSLKTLSWYREDLRAGDIIKDGEKVYVTFPRILDNGLLLIVNVPFDELYGEIYAQLLIITFLMILSVVFLVLVTHHVLTKNVNEPIEYLVEMAQRIGKGDLDAKMQIKNPDEFVQLADAFNKMTTDIKEHITSLNLMTAEKNKMEAELSIAHSIQYSSLPSIFPPYPNRGEFDIYANMVPAKEVGGDFYDFFFISENEFIFLIADVSGKGVPAALFMMEVKTLLRNIMKTGVPFDEAIEKVNHQICKNNEQGYFVTLFIVKINLKTGRTTYINAGHNPPLLKRGGADYSYLRLTTNIPLGVMDDFKYEKIEDKLFQGDELFLYTDGVTEATNKDLAFFGEGRLIEVLNQDKNPEIDKIIPNLKDKLEDFVQGEEQSDDITTLVFRYKGNVTNQE